MPRITLLDMQRRARALFLCAALLAPASSRALVTNLNIAADTFINSGLPDNNAGANAWFDGGTDGVGGVRRGLLRFDLSVIPPGSTVTSAVLQLTVIKVPSFGGVNSNFDLFRMTAGWNEGAQGGNAGGVAIFSEASWNARMAGIAGWTAPGAMSDVAGAASASTAVGSTLDTTYSWSGAGVVNDAQFWVDNPSLNGGWLLVSQAEASLRSVRGFASKENGAASGVLAVGYTPAPAPAAASFTSIRLTNTPAVAPEISLTNGSLRFVWQGATNGAFDLLYSASAAPGAVWKIAQPNIVASTNGSNFFPHPPYLASPAYPSNRALVYRLSSLPAPAPPLALRLQVVATNFVSPTVLTHAHDGSGRLFIADQVGLIRILDSASLLLPTPFLDISNRLVALRTSYDERGLLGLAFHPGYSTNGRFFVWYSAPPPNTNFDNTVVLSEFNVSGSNSNLADAGSEKVLLTIDEPESNHEGADLVFGPDGYLYLGPGDGGGSGDQHGLLGNAQMLTNLLGKILRIDVDAASPYVIPADNPFAGVPGARGEIYAYGFRNPCRFSFDRGGTHECFVADVGQNFYEEVNILRKGGNYGWRILEGTHAYDPALAGILHTNIPALDFPILEYAHGPLGIAIIGGFVYRGAGYPDLVGKYVCGDFSTSFAVPDGQLYYLAQTRPGIWERFTFKLYPQGGRLSRFVKGFGEDENGEIYVLSSTRLGPTGTTGDVRKLVRP